ncbi:40086_t:CDS:2, partial [Gigaspora margarita]
MKKSWTIKQNLIIWLKYQPERKKLNKLKDYEGLKKGLKRLIEKNDKSLKNVLQTGKNNNKTRNAEVNYSLRILKNKLERNTMNQVNNDQIKKINYQKIVNDKMDAILKDIKKKENNRIMIEAFFKNKQQNELENFIRDSKKEIEKLEENTEIKRHTEKSIYNSQILELDKQIDYLYDDYMELKKIEMVLQEETGALYKETLEYKRAIMEEKQKYTLKKNEKNG